MHSKCLKIHPKELQQLTENIHLGENPYIGGGNLTSGGNPGIGEKLLTSGENPDMEGF